MSDQDLLRQYAQEGSEEAFTALVMRYLNFVYSSARRKVRSDELAREVSQVVFLDLSLNAKQLRRDTHLASWLYVVTRRTAVDAIRRESRRQKREQVAVETAAMNSPSAIWSHVEPWLDEAVASLDENDRKAVLLRYFESKNLREIGEMLGVTEDAAQKRVSRAVERLREFLAKRGVTATAAGIAAEISANAMQTAPTGLGAAISSAVASSGTAIHKAAIIYGAKTVTMTTTQKTVAVAMLVAAIGGGIYQQKLIRRRDQQIAALDRQSMNSAEDMRSLRTQLDAAVHAAALFPGQNTVMSSSNAAGKSKIRSPIDPADRLRILEDLQKRKLLNSNMIFINPKGTLGSAFIELFSLTPEEQIALQKAIDDARRQIGNLMAANATVHRNSDNNVVISVNQSQAPQMLAAILSRPVGLVIQVRAGGGAKYPSEDGSVQMNTRTVARHAMNEMVKLLVGGKFRGDFPPRLWAPGTILSETEDSPKRRVWRRRPERSWIEGHDHLFLSSFS
jgi:RNA polymerase sigma factor (sigma-70 family)